MRRLAAGSVRTVTGGDLFDFGDRDGVGGDVRLQHPVGIASGPAGCLLVADTLNHKVKRLDPVKCDMRTLFGNGCALDASLAAYEHREPVPMDVRGTAFCREPEAVAWDEQRVLVVDTGNHRVLAVDPRTGAAEVWLG